MANIKEFLAMRDIEVVNKVARAHRLTKSDTLVLAYAASMMYTDSSAKDGGRVAVSRKKCAEETGLSEKTVQRAIKKLTAAGVMKMSVKGGFLDGKPIANVYEMSEEFQPIKQRTMENLQIVTKAKMSQVMSQGMSQVSHIENQQDNNLLQGQNDPPTEMRGSNEKELLETILLELRELRKSIENLEGKNKTKMSHLFYPELIYSNNSFVNVSCDNVSSQSRDENAREEHDRENEIISENEIEVGSEPAASVGDARNRGDRETQIKVKPSDGETSSGESHEKRHLSAPEPQNELPLKDEGENLSGGKPEPQGESAGGGTYPQPRKQDKKIEDTPPPPAPEKTLEEVLAEQRLMELEMFDDGNPTVSPASGNATLDEFNRCMRIMYAYDPIKCYEETLDIRDKAKRCIDAMRAEAPRPTGKQTKLFSDLQRRLDEAWRKKEEYIEKYAGDKKDSLTPYALLKGKFYDQCDEVCRCTDEKSLTKKYDKAFFTLMKMTALCHDAEDTKKLARHLDRRRDEAKALIEKIKSYKPNPATGGKDAPAVKPERKATPRGKVSDSEIERLYREVFVERTLDANTLPTDTLHALGRYADSLERSKPKPYPDTGPLCTVIHEPAAIGKKEGAKKKGRA